MKKTAYILTAVFVVCMTAGCESKNAIFTGKDLTGWSAYPSDTTHIWSVKDGVIRCEGKPNGYLRTEKEFSNYHLHLEWRWPQTPSNSGVLLHTTGPDNVWPNSIEAQLKNGDAGDIILIAQTGSVISAAKADLLLQTGEKPTARFPRQLDSSENQAEEWNSYDIFCKNDTIKVYVNGFCQNEISRASKISGQICLQSEGTPIEFRNIYINPLKP